MKIAQAIRRSAATIVMIALASTAASAAKSEQKLTYDSKSGKYCYKTMDTGTRVAKTTCLTREQWAAEGVKIP